MGFQCRIQLFRDCFGIQSNFGRRRVRSREGEREREIDRETRQEPPNPEEVEETSPEEMAEIKQKLKIIHRNLGHPNLEVMLRMLRDSGANEKVLDVAKDFSCEFCLQRGRRSPARPATTTKITEKWQCVSVDTFWWHTPKEVLAFGEKPTYVLGISMMDEATDYHTATLVKVGNEGPFRNMSGEDF